MSTREVAIMESSPAPSRSRRFSEASHTTAANPGPPDGAVGREPDVRQEDLAVAALAFTLDVGANVAAGAVAVQHAAQNGKIRLHVLALQRLLLEAQQLPRGFVGQQHASRADRA